MRVLLQDLTDFGRLLYLCCTTNVLGVCCTAVHVVYPALMLTCHVLCCCLHTTPLQLLFAVHYAAAVCGLLSVPRVLTLHGPCCCLTLPLTPVLLTARSCHVFCALQRVHIPAAALLLLQDRWLRSLLLPVKKARKGLWSLSPHPHHQPTAAAQYLGQQGRLGPRASKLTLHACASCPFVQCSCKTGIVWRSVCRRASSSRAAAAC
jgi:hypothetical protein